MLSPKIMISPAIYMCDPFSVPARAPYPRTSRAVSSLCYDDRYALPVLLRRSLLACRVRWAGASATAPTIPGGRRRPARGTPANADADPGALERPRHHADRAILR